MRAVLDQSYSVTASRWKAYNERSARHVPVHRAARPEKGCKRIYRASGPEHTTLQRAAQAADNVLRRTMPKALRPLVLRLPLLPSFSFEFLPAHARLPSHPHLAKIFLLTALYWRPRPPGRSSCQVPTIYPKPETRRYALYLCVARCPESRDHSAS